MNDGGIANHTPTVVGATSAAYVYLGLPLSVWVSIVTLTYLVLQIFCKLPEVIETIKRLRTRWRKDVEGIDDPP